MACAATAALCPALAGATIVPASVSGGVFEASAAFFADDFAYTPSELAIVPGAAATWSGDLRAHPLVFDDGPPGVSTGITYSLTFNDPGAYRFHCRIHGAQGMQGTLYVAGPRAELRSTYSAPTDTRVLLDASTTDFVDFTPNTAATYEFDANGDGVIDVVSTTPTTTFTYPAAGSYEAKVRVTDNDGRSSEGRTTVVIARAGSAAARPGRDTASPALTPATLVAVTTRALRAGTTIVIGSVSESVTVKGTLLLGTSVIGTASKSVRPDETITLKFKATRKGRSTLSRKRPRTLRLRLVLVDAAGNTTTVVRTLRVRRS